MSDVVVIGAGIIGCACAYELARRGAHVTILDPRAPGRGATQASAGVLAPFIEAPADTALQRLCVASLARYDDFVSNVTRDAKVDLDYHRTGTIEVALDDEEVALLERTVAVLEEMEVSHELLRGAAIARADPAISRDAVAALIVRDHGFVNAPALTAALVRAGGAHGVHMRAGVRATHVARSGGRLRIDTSAEPFEADFVVIAAGSWSGQIDVDGVVPAPVRPVRGQLLHLAWKTTPALSRVVWGSRCYMVPWTNGTLLVGATVEEVGFAEETMVAGIQTLLHAAIELVPPTASAGFLEARVGLRPASVDTLPLIGPSPDLPGLFYATGHYRNGILLAPLTAEMIADAIVDGRTHPFASLSTPSRLTTTIGSTGASHASSE